MNAKELTVILAQQTRLINNFQRVYEFDRKEWESLLHDQFGQTLAAIKSFSVGIQRTTELSDVKEISDIIIDAADELYITSYDMMQSLRSGLMKNTALIDGIKTCIDNSRLSQSGIAVDFDSSGDLESLEGILNVAILRIIQESLVNLARVFNPIKSSVVVRFHQVGLKFSHNNNSNHIEIKINAILDKNNEIEEPLSKFDSTKRYVESLGGNYDMVVAKKNINIKVTIATDDFIVG